MKRKYLWAGLGLIALLIGATVVSRLEAAPPSGVSGRPAGKKFGGSGPTPGPTAAVSLSVAQTFTKAQNVASVALTDAASIVTNASNSNVFTVTLGGNRTLANPTNLVSGGTYIWVIRQDATGSRTLAYGALFKFPGATAPVLSTTATSVDSLACLYDGTQLNCVATLAFG